MNTLPHLHSSNSKVLDPKVKVEEQILNTVADIEFWQDESLANFLEDHYIENNKETQLDSINSEINALMEQNKLLQKKLHDKKKVKMLANQNKEQIRQSLVEVQEQLKIDEIEIYNTEKELLKKRQFIQEMENPQKVAEYLINKLNFQELQVFSYPIINHCMNISHFYMQQHHHSMYKKYMEEQLKNKNINHNNNGES